MILYFFLLQYCLCISLFYFLSLSVLYWWFSVHTFPPIPESCICCRLQFASVVYYAVMPFNEPFNLYQHFDTCIFQLKVVYPHKGNLLLKGIKLTRPCDTVLQHACKEKWHIFSQCMRTRRRSFQEAAKKYLGTMTQQDLFIESSEGPSPWV